MKSKFLIIWWSLILVVSGCGTSSKVDDFIKKNSDIAVIQQPIENYTGTSDSLSEQLFLGGWDEPTSDGWYGEYTTFSWAGLSDVIGNTKRVVLTVFDAQCSNCKLLDSDVSTALSRIPSDVVVMKIDFNEAKTRYGVKEMNSVIYLNTDGSIKYLSDGGITSLENLLYYL